MKSTKSYLITRDQTLINIYLEFLQINESQTFQTKLSQNLVNLLSFRRLKNRSQM